MTTLVSDQLQFLFRDQNPLLLLLQEMSEGVLICDESRQILLINKALQDDLGFSEEVIGRSCSELIPEETLQESIGTVLETGKSQLMELSLMFHGQEKFFQLHNVPLMLETGRTGCVAIFHDITAIRRTEKMRRDFVANVSHELRTPLSAIKGYAETLLDGALEDEKVAREFVEIIHKHSLRLTQLVADLLDLSKLESFDSVPELRPVRLKSLIDRVFSMIESNASGKNLLFFLHLPEDLSPVLADPSNLEQVLTNLLDNAVKYTPEGGKIAVSAFEADNNMIQVNIKDTGLGIEPKHIPRLFERFYRVDKARSRQMGGTGLGLSIVKHIIQVHGGDIWVESVPNQGTTFSFTLPKGSFEEETPD